MRRLVAGGAAATLLAGLTTLTPTAPARAGTDTAPPAIGSCYVMTLQEVSGASNAGAPVSCASPHTTTTFDVVEFAEAPDWNDEDSFASEVYDQCNLSWLDVLGGDPKTIGRSSYTYYWLMPTPQQRDAGAAWVRCELVLTAGGSLGRLPQHVRLGGLPLPDRVARCVEGPRTDYRTTICSKRHRYRATRSIRIPGDRWRGEDAVQSIALRECRERVRSDFRYSWPSSKYWWRLGYRYAICFPRTSG